MYSAALHGFILSFGLILPIGMQNGFILAQGALHPRWAGFLPAVLTAAICDTSLIALAVWGVGGVALQVAWLRWGLGLVGIAFLVVMGLSTLRQAPATVKGVTAQAWPPRRQVAFAATTSLLNPHALLDTLAVIGGSAAVYSTWSERLAFGAASTVVSWVWFFGLATAGHLLGRAALRGASTAWVGRISALLMLGSAVYLGFLLFR